MDIANSLKSWQRISDASKFYQTQGYLYHPVEWQVEEEFHRVTFPEGPLYTLGKLALVGSAEQSFIKDFTLLQDDTFYFAISPCFRLGDEGKSPLHRTYFLKLELFYKTKNNPQSALDKIIADAQKYFHQFSSTELVKTNSGFDLNINQIEVGSYGIRNYQNQMFVYGTGCAEPRLSMSLGEV